MQPRPRLLLILCLAFIGSACAGRDFKVDKLDASGNKLEVKVGGVDVTVKIGEAEKERADISRQLEELKTELAANNALHADERAKLQQRQIALQEKLLALTEQLAAMRQGDANLRRELGRVRDELKTNSEELVRLRGELATRSEAERRAPAAPTAEPDGVKETEADESPVSFALLVNDTDYCINFSVVREDETLEGRRIEANQQIVLEHSGDGIEIQFGARRYTLDSVTRVGSRSAAPADSELPGNYFDLDDDGRVSLFSETDE